MISNRFSGTATNSLDIASIPRTVYLSYNTCIWEKTYTGAKKILLVDNEPDNTSVFSIALESNAKHYVSISIIYSLVGLSSWV
jgi:hypothetical protein